MPVLSGSLPGQCSGDAGSSLGRVTGDGFREVFQVA